MKKYILFTLLVVMCLLLTACQCEHEWQKADCVNPRLCAKCSESQGVALGHSWASATCDAAKTCTRCGQLEGNPLGHAWEAATCEAAKTCKNCGKTEGDPLGHTADPATCEAAGVCKTCNKEVEKAKGHNAEPATCEAASVCKTCGKEIEKAKGHNWTPATATTPKTCATCGKTDGTALKKEHLGLTEADYVAKMDATLAVLGYKMEYLGEANDGMHLYGVYTAADGVDTNAQIIFVPSSDQTHVLAVMSGSDYGADPTVSNLVGKCFGAAAYLADNTFSDQDTKALQDSVTASPDGKIYNYQHARNGLLYKMIVTQTSDTTINIAAVVTVEP